MNHNDTPHAQSAQETQTAEQWRDIPDCNGRYQVSDHGRVRAYLYQQRWHTEPRYIKHFLSNVGYVTYKLNLMGKSRSYSAHRLVMLAFVGPSELTVNHKNGNKQDNRVCNLEYMTHADNIRHSYNTLGRKSARGERAGNARLSDAQVEWLRKLAVEGKSNGELAQIFDVSVAHVSNVKLGKLRIDAASLHKT